MPSLQSALRILFPVIFAGSFVLAGCSTPHLVTLKDGREYTAKGEPDYDHASGFYEFETTDGRSIELNKDMVESIHRQ